MSFVDRIKQTAEDLDLQHKAGKLAEHAGKAAHQAVEQAGEMAYRHRGKVEGALDKAGKAIDDRTEGKYAGKIAKAKEQVGKGVDMLANQRPAHATEEDGWVDPTDAAGNPNPAVVPDPSDPPPATPV